jgi:hypothetical protein
MQNRIAILLELIAEVINGPGVWKEKRAAILNEATKSDRTNLEEFSSWFAPTD